MDETLNFAQAAQYGDEEEIEPTALDLLAQDLVTQPYESAVSKLKEVYETTNWTDKELAAQKTAEISDILNKRDEVNPDITLDTDVTGITQKLLDNSLDEDGKIEAIEDWLEESTAQLYNTDDSTSLISASAKERMLKDYALQMRREIVAGDTNVILDKLARGAEAMIAPLVDTADVIIGSNGGAALREYAALHEDPKRDNDLTSVFASGVGSVGGFAIAALNPYTAIGYLGATLTSQGKQVYDTALKETGSEEAAKSALLNSAPGITLQAFADRLIGGTIAKTALGKKGFLNTFTGTVAGAAGMGTQSFLTGKALVSATGQSAFEPRPEDVAKETLVGGVLGAAAGGLHDLSRSELGFKKAANLFKKTTGNPDDAPPPDAPTEANSVDDFLDQFVVSKETIPDQAEYISKKLAALKGLTEEEPLNADAVFSELTQYGTPSERISELENILAERNKAGLVATRFPEPLEGEALTAKELELQEDIDHIKALGDVDLADRLQKNLNNWKQQQQAYMENPENAAIVKEVYNKYRELTKKFYTTLEETRNQQSQINADVEAQGFGYTMPEPGDYEAWAAGHQVFDVYHGSGADFTAFSKEYLGKNTQANSAKVAFFGAATPKTAEAYLPQRIYTEPIDVEKLPSDVRNQYDALQKQRDFIFSRANEEHAHLSDIPLSDRAEEMLMEAGEDFYNLADLVSRHEYVKESTKEIQEIIARKNLDPGDPLFKEMNEHLDYLKKVDKRVTKAWNAITELPEVKAELQKGPSEETITKWKASAQETAAKLKDQLTQYREIVRTYKPDPEDLGLEILRIRKYNPGISRDRAALEANMRLLSSKTDTLNYQIMESRQDLRQLRSNLRDAGRIAKYVPRLEGSKVLGSRMRRVEQAIDKIESKYAKKTKPLMYKLKIRAKNPFVVDVEGANYSALHRTPWKSLTDIITTAKAKGHDAVVIKNMIDPYLDTYYAWFEPNQARVPWARFSRAAQESAELNADVGPTVLDAAQNVPLGGGTPARDLSALQKVIPAVEYGYSPQPAVVALTNKLLGELTDPTNPLQIQLADETAMGAMFGYQDPRTHAVVLRRQLFRHQDQARKTMAHELGHLVDGYNRSEAAKQMLAMQPRDKEPIVVKLTRLGAPLKQMYTEAEVGREAKDISAQQRPGWDPIEPIPATPPPEGTPERAKYDYQVYRNSPNEIHADVMSAILNRPQEIKAQFPNVWAAFEAGLDAQPIIKKFWDDIQAMNNDPVKLSEFLRQERQAGRKREASATAKNAERQILMHKELKRQQLAEAGGIIRQRIGNRFSVAKDVVDKMVGTVDEHYAEELYGKLYSGPMSSSIQDAMVNEPEVLLFKEVKALASELPEGVDPVAEMKQLMNIKHVLEDTTPEMTNIKSDPAGYREAADVIQAEAAKYAAATKTVNPIENLSTNVAGREGQPLVDALATTHLYLKRDVRKAIAAQIMKDRGKVLTPADMKALEVLEEGAFSARRYVGNPIDPKTSEIELALMKNRLGEEGFNKLSKLHDRHHEILFNYLYPRVKESGILTPHMEKRFEQNKSSYTTFNALKYFEKDPHITASIRRAIGNVNQIGDEWAATIRKVRMVGARADFQIASNAAVELAGKSGVDIKEIKPKINVRYNKQGESSIYIDSLYRTQKEMQAAHPENSYLIATEEGKSALFEIKDPRWAKMFEKSAMEQIPVVRTALSLLEDFNRIFGERELKTALSPGFWLRSKFYDRSQEALAGNAPWYEFPGLPFHISKTFREQYKAAKQYVSEFQRGEVNKAIEGLIKYNGIPHHMTEEVGGYYSPALRAENMIYEDLGFKIPGEEELDIPLRINRTINKAFDTIGFGKLRRAVETDELRAKVTMYLIGKNIKGMGDARAARFAREIGGTPDPFGGGIEAGALNKLFLFGRAHVNGMRGLYSMFKDSPGKFGVQYFYRKVMPRMLVSSAVMGPLIGAMFGKEEEEIYRKFLDKIPSFDKLSKFNIPLGFIDDKGSYRDFGSVSPTEINQNWKASYVALPMSRDLVTADTLMNPFFENLENYINNGTLSAKRIAQSITTALNSSFTGQFAPGIMSATRMGQFISGGNPHDYYRNRGVFPKDVEEAGTLLDKSYRYLVWSLNQTAPGIFSFNPDKQSSTEPSTPWDYLSSTPLAGATVRAFVRQSNYGDLEKYKELERVKVERDADIRLGMGDKSKMLYNDYRKTQSYITRMGKDWALHSTPQQIRRVHILQNWHTRAYRWGFNGMRAAFDKDDSEALQRESEKLESASAYVAELLE